MEVSIMKLLKALNLFSYVYVEKLPYLKFGFGRMYFLVHFTYEVIPGLHCICLTSFIFFIKYNILELLQHNHYNALDFKKFMHARWPDMIQFHQQVLRKREICQTINLCWLK
jgi:hypothetical protein